MINKQQIVETSADMCKTGKTSQDNPTSQEALEATKCSFEVENPGCKGEGKLMQVDPKYLQLEFWLAKIRSAHPFPQATSSSLKS